MSVKVSIIIPVYNAQSYLANCLDSVLSQTLREIEVICVNDGSTDSSLQILQSYAAKDSRIRVISQENGGAGAARNTGMKNASGQYYSFLDADDFFEPDMLECAYKKGAEKDLDVVVFKSDQYLTEEDRFNAVTWVVREKELPPYEPFDFRGITTNVFKVYVGWAWDKLFRADFVKAHDLTFQEQRTTNDMLFVFSSIVLAQRMGYVGKVLIHQRRDAKDSVSKSREDSWHCFYDALSALRERLRSESLWFELQKDYINYALHAVLWNYNTLAEPAKSALEQKLKSEWLEDLGIAGKDAAYFYNRKEYDQYRALFAK